MGRRIVILWVAILGVSGARPVAKPADGPSVLIVLWDTVRADRMSLYGHIQPTTPRLQQWARDAVVYERAVSPGMWTVPAHGSLFTGLPVSSHGAHAGWTWLDARHVTLAEHFSAAGYATFAYSSNPYLSEQTNLLDGFAVQRFSWRGADAARTAEATRAKLIATDSSVEISPGFDPDSRGEGWPAHLTVHKDGAPVVADALLAWVDTLPPGAPFVGFVNFLEAHHPRVPRMASRRAVADEAVVQRALRTDLSLLRLMSAMEGVGSLDADELEALAATYDAALVDLDTATDALLTGLQERGRLDDTIVVILSDHGEHLGEHGRFDHRWSIGQPLIHVPLVVRWPAGLDPVRVSEPVSTGDLFGSLLDWTGVAPPPGVPLGRLGRQHAVVSELVAPMPRLPQVRRALPDLPGGRWRTRYRARIEGPLKLVRTQDNTSLYDLSTDPLEDTDLSTERLELTARMGEALRAWDVARPPLRLDLRAPTDRPGRPLRADVPGHADQLRALGYATEDRP